MSKQILVIPYILPILNLEDIMFRNRINKEGGIG